jgi:antitoxin (DNA-binding transcriptional repressor) of toxin-antitoxin stability system
MFVHSSNHKGNVAELAIATAAAKLGVSVLKPLTEHERYDLVFELGGRFWRVQCKSARLAPTGDFLIVSTRRCRRVASGQVSRTYTEEEVDLFGAYSDDLNRCFLFPISIAAGISAVQLRLTPPRNGQRACVNLAEDFEFAGAVAQLARARRWQRRGQGFESPQLHLSGRSGLIRVGSNRFRDGFGYWMDRVAAGDEVVVTRRGRPLVHLRAAVSSAAAVCDWALVPASARSGGARSGGAE